MRIDYTDGALRAKIYELFDTSFPRISARIRTAESLGAKWHDVSTAFIEFVDEVPAAHAGVIFIPLVITGKECVVAGIHAVCTHPEFRGRGLARNVLREALAFADTKSETAVLTTAIPDLYARFGFRVLCSSDDSPCRTR